MAHDNASGSARFGHFLLPLESHEATRMTLMDVHTYFRMSYRGRMRSQVNSPLSDRPWTACSFAWKETLLHPTRLVMRAIILKNGLCEEHRVPYILDILS